MINCELTFNGVERQPQDIYVRIPVPAGYHIIAYRPPVIDEMYLDANYLNVKVVSRSDSRGPRFIVEKFIVEKFIVAKD